MRIIDEALQRSRSQHHGRRIADHVIRLFPVHLPERERAAGPCARDERVQRLSLALWSHEAE